MVRSRTYEITLTGQARTMLRAEFDDCQIREPSAGWCNGSPTSGLKSSTCTS